MKTIILFLVFCLVVVCFGSSHGDNCALGNCAPSYDATLIFHAKTVTNSSSAIGLPVLKAAFAAANLNFTRFETRAFNQFLFQFGLDFFNAPISTNPFYYKEIPGVAAIVAYVFNPNNVMDYRATLVGGYERGIENFECANLQVLIYDVLIFNASALGGYWKSHILAPGAVVDDRYISVFYFVDVLTYRDQHNVPKKKYLTGCSIRPSITHQESNLMAYAHTVFIDEEPDQRKNWGIGDSVRENNFIPTAPIPGMSQQIFLRQAIDFPAHLNTHGIRDATCIPTAA